jgi:hypothetical protein
MVWVGKRQEARGKRQEARGKRQEIKGFIVFYTYLLRCSLFARNAVLELAKYPHPSLTKPILQSLVLRATGISSSTSDVTSYGRTNFVSESNSKQLPIPHSPFPIPYYLLPITYSPFQFVSRNKADFCFCC